MSRFIKGDKVSSPLFKGYRIVKDPEPDVDGDIKIRKPGEACWHFFNERRLEKVSDLPPPQPPLTPELPKTTKGTTTMKNECAGSATMRDDCSGPRTNRRTVNVQLIDPDIGLPVEDSLVKDFGLHVVEGDDQDIIQELIMTGDVKEALDIHNMKRAETVNLDTKNRTGAEVQLDPVKLRQLKWVIK